MARLDDLLAAVDVALSAHEATKREALSLVADNPWCVTALSRVGIAVPSSRVESPGA